MTGGKVAAGLPNYYWNNLRPFTQIMNIHTGITEIGNPRNPFDALELYYHYLRYRGFSCGQSRFSL